MTLFSLVPLLLITNEAVAETGEMDNRRSRVVIVGGGIAGCAAAWSLKESFGENIDLKIVEAGEKLGGRISTIPWGSGESKLELGANWMHGTEENPLHEFLVERDLMRAAEEEEEVWIGVSKGGVVVPEEMLIETYRFLAVDLENARTAFFEEGRTPSGPDADDDALNFTLRYQKRYLLDEAKDEEEKRLLRGMCRYANLAECNAWGCDNLGQVSLAKYGNYKELEGGDVPLKNGFGSVIDYFNESFAEEELLLETVVDTIFWDREGDSTGIDSEIEILLSNGQTLRAEFVIVTVSAGCLQSRRPKFEPRLPKKKRDAVDKIGYGTVDKIYLQLNRDQLSALKDVIGGSTTSVSFLWDEDVDSEDLKASWTRGLNGFDFVREDLLLFWIHGVEARFFETLDNAAVLQSLDRVFARFLKTNIGTFQDPRRMLRTSWHSNEYTLGSYSFPAKGSPMDVRDALAEPILSNGKTNGKPASPKLMFAGEATHPYFYSTAHGAFESGLREAHRIRPFVNSGPFGTKPSSCGLFIFLTVFLFVFVRLF